MMYAGVLQVDRFICEDLMSLISRRVDRIFVLIYAAEFVAFIGRTNLLELWKQTDVHLMIPDQRFVRV